MLKFKYILKSKYTWCKCVCALFVFCVSDKKSTLAFPYFVFKFKHNLFFAKILTWEGKCINSLPHLPEKIQVSYYR